MKFSKSLRVLSGIAAASTVLAASPAHANNTAAAAQITGIVKSDAAVAGEGDREFQQLYASWKALDGTEAVVGSAAPKLSIPTLSPLKTYRLSSDFGTRRHPVLGSVRAHHGLDMAAPTGTPIYAPGDGYIEKASAFGSYGKFIEIEHGGGVETRYGHLSDYAVNEGQYVRKGDLIGYVGSTGRSTGPHLHYEVRIDGQPVDPNQYMYDTLLASSDTPGATAGGSK
ncbi:M23 family metallopeptidase [Altericroceibacterium xinjiangense]|uniref:M23 family metallopeptidase n=1 Tax=Altericroceibacterium xinjiangense TaxID=762261 RepID=UPI000F7E4273|nr:M23 family metallopeptidase [Altericroceibacterium xinjiangense]